MNKRDLDVLLALKKRRYPNQRALAEKLKCSLGAANASLQILIHEGYLDEKAELTEKSRSLFCACAPKRAVLLAAGLGFQNSSPLSEIPRALLKVRGEVLIERLIRQLHAAGVRDICVVVGFCKEKFEYLIDTFGVTLEVNPQYAAKHNLHSLCLVKEKLENCYIVPADLWCQKNPFRRQELYSWYMVSEALSGKSSVRVNRKQELAVSAPGEGGNAMIGISYLLKKDAEVVKQKLSWMDADLRFRGSFWEETLYEGDKLWISPRVVSADAVAEITSAEDLQELNHPVVFPLKKAAQLLKARAEEITEINVLKRGSTNRTFSFVCRGEKYVLRLVSDGENKLIDRKREAAVYEVIAASELSEDVLFAEGETGLKLSRFIESDRFCDPQNKKEIKRCMQALRAFHQKGYAIEQEFDLFDAVEYFESLWDGPSVYGDYEETKRNVFSLKAYIDAQPKEKCLVHLDAVWENFMLGKDTVRLIDWEYAAMGDPHLDIAMFALYALYGKAETDTLIDAYFPEGCEQAVRLKIYCYMAAGGLLWSNWCSWRQKSGIEFGAYSMRQYRAAKEYYRVFIKEQEKQNEKS